MNNNLDGAHNQNITGGKCQTTLSTTTVNAVVASATTAVSPLPASPAAIITTQTSLTSTPIIIKSTSDSECNITRSTDRTSDPNISNFFRKLSSGLDATDGSAIAAASVQQSNVKISDSSGVPESGTSKCDANGVSGSESVDGGKTYQPYMSSGCFAHRRQSYGNSGAADVSNLSEAELREIIRELTNKMEYTERMNWLCKYIYVSII